MKRRWHKVDAEKTKCREVLIPQPLEMTRNGGKPDRRSTLIQDQGRDTTAYNNNKREIHCEGRIEENFSSCKRDTCYCTASLQPQFKIPRSSGNTHSCRNSR